MRYFFLAVIFALTSIGCSKNSSIIKEQNPKLVNMIDSVRNIIQKNTFSQHHGYVDTIEMNYALAMLDTIIKKDEGKSLYYNCYQNKSQIYIHLGMYDKALVEMENAINLLAEDNIDRIAFYAIKYHYENNTDSAHFYYDKCMSECNDKLHNEFNENYIIYKAQLLYVFYSQTKAITFLEGVKRENSNDTEIAKTINTIENDIPKFKEYMMIWEKGKNKMLSTKKYWKHKMYS